MKRFLWELFWFVLQLSLLLILPFVILIKGSVYIYSHYEWHTWLALLAGGLMTFVLVLLYFVLIYGTLFGAKKLSRSSIKTKAVLAGLLVIGYCGYTLLSFSPANAKTEAVREEFTSLHPFLRLGVGTVLFLDPGLLVTDMSRTHADYEKMGMKTKRNSLHYLQSDGYVHAMDLRTKGRSAFRNWILSVYFKSMGFNTLRHVGTADHLHVSLISHDRPGSI